MFKKSALQRKFEILIDLVSRYQLFVCLFNAYYHLGIKFLNFFLRFLPVNLIARVYIKHRHWIVPSSDIDFIFIIRTSSVVEESRFFKSFWKIYQSLRFFFPMFCELNEVRFIPHDQIEKHPLIASDSVLTLPAQFTWECVCQYSPIQFVGIEKLAAVEESTAHYNAFGNVQWSLLAGQHITQLRFRRLSKLILKILTQLDLMSKHPLPQEHLTLNKEIKSLTTTVSTDSQERKDKLLFSLRRMILMADQVHHSLLPLNGELLTVKHQENKLWDSDLLQDFIKKGQMSFGQAFQVLVVEPVCEHNTRVYIIIDQSWSDNKFIDLIVFINLYNQSLFESRFRLILTTVNILASQYYFLWHANALETELLLVRGMYNPRGLFKVYKVPDEWTKLKIRHTLSIYNEYYLPFLTSPMAKGAGIDFCKIYERQEIEMLFHYFYYLKDNNSYFDDVMNVQADSHEVLCLTAAKYGHELGINEWHPTNYFSAYPYVRTLIRLIGPMTYE